MFGSPSLASDTIIYDDYYLYLVAEGQDDSGQDIWFARCTNRGVSFETPYKIGNLTTDARGYYRPDVCWGQSGWVHVTWCFRYDTPDQDIAVRYRRAPSSAGGGDSSWYPIARLSTNNNGLDEYCPHLEASHESPQVAIVYSRRQYVSGDDDYLLLPPGFLGSYDNGMWFSVAQITTGSAAIMNDLVYQGATDDFVALGLLDGGPAVFRAARDVLDDWSEAESFADQAYAVDENWTSGLATNPARSDELAASWSAGTVAETPNRPTSSTANGVTTRARSTTTRSQPASASPHRLPIPRRALPCLPTPCRHAAVSAWRFSTFAVVG